MYTQELDSLKLIKNEEQQSSINKNDLDALKLKEQKENNSYDSLEGTGVKPLRIISGILIVLGIILCITGIVLISNKRYHPERIFIGLTCIYFAISCFLVSPIYKVLATIGEAAKIYKDKNTKKTY